MKLLTQLTHFDAQTAVCLATIEDGEKRVSVYASAQASEAGNYVDLAQQRALHLAWRFLQEGYVLLQDAALIMPTPVRANINPTQAFERKPVEETSAPESELSSSDVADATRADDKPESSMPW
jgi:hypothetical protein